MLVERNRKQQIGSFRTLKMHFGQRFQVSHSSALIVAAFFSSSLFCSVFFAFASNGTQCGECKMMGNQKNVYIKWIKFQRACKWYIYEANKIQATSIYLDFCFLFKFALVNLNVHWFNVTGVLLIGDQTSWGRSNFPILPQFIYNTHHDRGHRFKWFLVFYVSFQQIVLIS